MRYMSSRKIDDFEAFKIYLAMKHHFADRLDYKKYGTTNTKKETYLNRKDKKTFEELSRRYDKKSLEEFLLSVFVNVTDKGNLAIHRNEYMHSKYLLDSESSEIHKAWKKRIHSIKYTFKSDCEVLFAKASSGDIEFPNIFKSVGNDYPFIVQLEQKGEICLETLVIFEKIFGFLKRVKINDTTYWPEYRKKVEKYMSFLDVELDYYVGVVKTLLIEDYYENYGKYI